MWLSGISSAYILSFLSTDWWRFICNKSLSLKTFENKLAVSYDYSGLFNPDSICYMMSSLQLLSSCLLNLLLWRIGSSFLNKII